MSTIDMMVRKQIISPFSDQYPREVAFLDGDTMKRVTVFNSEELNKKLKQKLRFSNTYYSVYGFQNTSQNGYRCDYNTAVIDRLFADFDTEDTVKFEVGKDDDDNPIEQVLIKTTPWRDAFRLHLWCMNQDLLHAIVFSGRGYHVYIFTIKQLLEYPRDTVLKAIINILTYAGYKTKEYGKVPLNADIRAMGRPDQLARVIGSYNYKAVKRGDSKGYVIPVSKELMALGHKAVINQADRQREKHLIVYGSKLLNLDQWDDGEYVTKEKFYLWTKNTEERANFSDIGNPLSSTLEISDSYHLFPPCIQTIIVSMQTKKIPYDTVLQLSVFLRDAGWTIDEQMKFWHTNYVENKSVTFSDFEKNEISWFEHTYGERRGSRRGGYHAFKCETSRQRGSCPFGQNTPDEIKEVADKKFKGDIIDLIVIDTSGGKFKRACYKWMCGELKIVPEVESETSYAISYYEDMRRQLLEEPIVEYVGDIDSNIPPCIVARYTKGISAYTSRAIVSILYWTGHTKDMIDEMMTAIGVRAQVYTRTIDNPANITCSSLTRRNLCIKPKCKWSNTWGINVEFTMMDDFDREGIINRYKLGFSDE